MDLIAQLREAGFEVINGHRRLAAALSVGSSILATDDQGKFYNISSVGGKVHVEPLTNVLKIQHGLLPACIVRQVEKMSSFPVETAFLPIESLTPSPFNTRLPTFSFRAECEQDAVEFLAAVEGNGFSVQGTVIPDVTGLPDFDVEVRTDANLEQLREVVRTIPDGHVMLQTLRQVPLAGNSLERDYGLE
ncbi:TPA: hypothetical protein ACKP9S_003611 [Pseudomonas aeruginosa]